MTQIKSGERETTILRRFALMGADQESKKLNTDNSMILIEGRAQKPPKCKDRTMLADSCRSFDALNGHSINFTVVDPPRILQRKKDSKLKREPSYE